MRTWIVLAVSAGLLACGKQTGPVSGASSGAGSTAGSTGSGATSGAATSTGSHGATTGVNASTGSGTSHGATTGLSGSTLSSGSTSGSTGSTGGAPNDLCAGALTLVEGTPVSGDTSTAANDYHFVSNATSCTGYSDPGPDLIYAFTPSATGRYTFTATPGPGFDVAIYLLDACPPTLSGANLASCPAGVDAHGNGSAESFSANLVGGTTYSVVVDAWDAQSMGPFTLQVTAAGSAPTNDTCAGATPLTLNATVSGDTTPALSDYAPTASTPGCTGNDNPGPDLVYAFTAPADARYLFTLAPESSFDGSLYALDTCPPPSGVAACLAGADRGGAGDAEQLLLPLSAGSTCYLVVDAHGVSTTGAFQLSAAIGPAAPANDTCTSPETLTEGLSATGDTTFAANDLQPGGCGSSDPSAGDLVYTFTPAADGRFRFTLSPDTSLDAILSVFTGCPSASDAGAHCLAGADHHGAGDAEVLTLDLQGGVTYLVVADSYSNTAGSFTLEVDPVATPLGDTCALLDAPDGGSNTLDLGAGALPDGGARVTATSDTSGLNDDSQSSAFGACAGAGSGPDQVFRVRLPGPVPSVTATVRGQDGGNSSPVVYLRAGPCSELHDVDGGPAELACGLASGGSAVATTGALDGGDIFLWVDSPGSSGPASVTVTVP